MLVADGGSSGLAGMGGSGIFGRRAPEAVGRPMMAAPWRIGYTFSVPFLIEVSTSVLLSRYAWAASFAVAGARACSFRSPEIIPATRVRVSGFKYGADLRARPPSNLSRCFTWWVQVMAARRAREGLLVSHTLDFL